MCDEHWQYLKKIVDYINRQKYTNLRAELVNEGVLVIFEPCCKPHFKQEAIFSYELLHDCVCSPQQLICDWANNAQEKWFSLYYSEYKKKVHEQYVNECVDIWGDTWKRHCL